MGECLTTSLTLTHRSGTSDQLCQRIMEWEDTMIDLWPEDIRAVSVKAPVTILREQAAFLGQRTKNIVTAEVVRCVSIDTVKFAFYIVGPAISNYRWRVFTMSYGAEYYPLTLELAPGVLQGFCDDAAPHGVTATISSRDEFLVELRKVFAADKTLRVIRAILALSGVEPDD